MFWKEHLTTLLAGAESSLKMCLFFPLLLPHDGFFFKTDNTWGSMETFQHHDIVDNSCLTHSHSFPTFEQCSSITQHTWYAVFCLVTEEKHVQLSHKFAAHSIIRSRFRSKLLHLMDGKSLMAKLMHPQLFYMIALKYHKYLVLNVNPPK